ncbi:DoxX family protein [Streptomyces sp. NPDC046977]|uniref:DoxX family protein n=1 Tax=Streptomyces sp. NPDC046977 TaxID=3154703 RepID=UPI0033C4E600
MTVFLWVLAAVLAALFLGSGAMKLLRSKTQLANSGQGWVEPVPAGSIKLIGALEVAAAVGLVLPPALDIAPALAPVAAVGLVVLMVGAAITHARRREMPNLLVNIVLAVLAAVVVWGRFGPYAF